jgi:hypothetical protein
VNDPDILALYREQVIVSVLARSGQPMSVRLPFVLCLTVLAACAGGERWFNSDHDDVSVDGANFRVSWARSGDQQFDFRAFRNESFVLFPDLIIEKQMSMRAVTIVAARLCPRQKVAFVSDSKDGQMYLFRARCVGGAT